MGYTYNNIPNVVILKADSHSQNTEIEFDGCSKPLVTEKQFWGEKDKKKEGLYYNYTKEDNTLGFAKPHEGWSYYSEKDSDSLTPEQTDEWVKNNILEFNKKSLCIVQGYAGCGKTTFVYDVLKRALESGAYSSYHNFYIGHNKKINENAFIPSAIQAKIVNEIINELKEDDGLLIYENFVKLFSLDLSSLNPVLYTHFAELFNSKTDASLYQYAKDIHNKNYDCPDVNFRVQFNVSLGSRIAKLTAKNNDKLENKTNDSLDILLCIDFLWHCAVSMTRKPKSSTNHIIIYDNLDIIDDHRVVADFIDTLREILENYNEFKNDLQQISDEYQKYTPSFKCILTVRKITYASISRFVEVGNNERRQDSPEVDFLDISALYPPAKVLKHRSKIILDNIESYIPKESLKFTDLKNYLGEITKMPDDLFSDIKLSELLNQNIRACANMIDKIIESSIYKTTLKDVDYSSSQVKKLCRSAIWINIICKILKDLKVWDNMGYNLSYSKELTHPTTLSRMILTYISNYRQGFSKGNPGFNSNDVSLKDIIETFEDIPFCVLPKNASWEKDIIPLLEENNSKEDTHNKIIEIIAKMLQRNETVESLELWRRPLYYTQNTFSITNITNTEKILKHQIKNFSDPDCKITSFCITDEGNTFVEKLATHFEFSSIRFNGNKATPLCCITTPKTLNEIIAPVFRQIEICATKQVWIMNYYIKKNNKNTDCYLEELFHPRITEYFIPQLHIVRTIYDHINYLNNCRENLHESKQLSPELDKTLLKWIGKYLELYNKKMFSKLEGTVSNHYNEVWLDLKYLYWLIHDNIIKNEFLSVNRNNCSFDRKSNKQYIISDDVLRQREMLEHFDVDHNQENT